jgi:hypothetical protein
LEDNAILTSLDLSGNEIKDVIVPKNHVSPSQSLSNPTQTSQKTFG